MSYKELKKELDDLIAKTENLQDEKIIKKSQELDSFIVKEQQRKLQDNLLQGYSIS